MTRAPLLALLVLCAVAGAALGQAPSFPTSLGAFRLETERLGPGTVTLVPGAGGPASAYPTIQGAVDAAQEGDTVLLSDGLFTGPGNRDIHVTRNVEIRSQHGPARCVVDCQRRGRAFFFEGPLVTSQSSLRGVTIVRGRPSEVAPIGSLGGGIAVFECSPTLEACVVRSCEGSSAGGVFYGNTESPVAGVLRDCVIADNWSHADAGGLLAANALVERCRVTGNAAALRGGGVSATLRGTIRDCLIARNSITQPVSRGGGMVVFGSDYRIENCTIVDNHGPTRGGGIAVSFGIAPVVSSCIVWGNTAGITGDQIHVDVASTPAIRYCTIQSGSAGIGLGLDARPAVIGIGTLDPSFVDTVSFRLALGSPSIDAGDPLIMPDPDEGDLDGYPRVASGIVDVGCYETWPGLALSRVRPGRAGELNAVDVRGADPCSPIGFFYGQDPGRLGLGFGACPDFALGITDPVLFAVGRTSSSGTTSYSALVPAELAGVGLYLQTVTFDPISPESGCAVSNLVDVHYR